MSDMYHYGVNWELKTPLPLWQLTGSHQLRIDITSQFNSKFRLVALRELAESESDALKLLMGRGTIPSTPCGQRGYRGYDEAIFKHTPRPGNGWGWYVSNDCHEFPGWRHSVSHSPAIFAGDSLCKFLTRHPKDGYTVQFHNVPWGLFKRYWRKPINLDKQFHGDKKKNKFGKNQGFSLGFPSIGVLSFTPDLTRDYKCIIADFARMGAPGDTVNMKIYEWMINYARQFLILSDSESPFVKDDAELCFTMEWM